MQFFFRFRALRPAPPGGGLRRDRMNATGERPIRFAPRHAQTLRPSITHLSTGRGTSAKTARRTGISE